MALYFQIVNNTGSAENSFLYNSKVIQLTVNGRSFPKRTLKTIYYSWFIQWADILPCTLTAIAPATFTCHFFPMSRDGVQNVCVMHDRYSTLPPPPPSAFATLYQHSPTRLILRGSPTRSRTLGTGFMDPTNPPTHPNPHGLSAEKRSPLRLSNTCLIILHPFATPLKWRWRNSGNFAGGQPYGASVTSAIRCVYTSNRKRNTHTKKRNSTWYLYIGMKPANGTSIRRNLPDV